jgi:hypothetical protein
MNLKSVIEPPMNTDETRIYNGFFRNCIDTILMNEKTRVMRGSIRVNPCSSVAKKRYLE